jgi:membrane protease subunit HflC
MNKQTITIIIIAVLAVVALAVLSEAIYIVDETEQVVITQFGKIIGDPITNPGLHVKIPFVHQVNTFDKRLLDWNGEKTVSKTLEQKFISVEVYARWRIIEPRTFLQTVSGRIQTALSRLDAVIDPVVRDVIARYELKDLVRSDTDKPMIVKVLSGISSDGVILEEGQEVENGAGTGESDPRNSADMLSQSFKDLEEEIYDKIPDTIEFGRKRIVDEITKAAQSRVGRYGIELVDVRIKRINYQPQTRRQVYNRMIAERRSIEALYISQGEQQAAEIQGRKDREIKLIQSRADQIVLKTLGEGEAQAINIYAEAYERDTEFYKFYKSLETLRNTVSSQTMLILSTNSEFYRIFRQIGGGR